ncbi:leucine--tRNA ligase [Verrucomicrobiota bacterium]|nr:leucine--tRNA ligase [Verrucomicrobiota bacterium]
MSSVRRQYPFQLIEPKWQRFWDDQQTFRAWNPGEKIPVSHPFSKRHGGADAARVPKYYILDMFPYPSGAGLHVGHPEGYTATDILARYRRARGFNVLHPMGWDSFGLPAEQYAVKTGQHPRKTTEANITTFKRQIQSLGFSYDWSRELATTDPEYFRWTQWIFLQIYHAWFNPETNRVEPISTLRFPEECDSEEKRRAFRDSKRLAYVSEAPVNWCPELGTVLANEEVIDGKSEVGGFPVIRKPMRQWLLRITALAERLLNDLETIEWSHSLKEMQRNWIGRSEGAEVEFRIQNSEARITVFTTRPDTLFGATYMVLSPEHKLVAEITTDAQRDAVKQYQQFATTKSDLERTELAKDKTGVFTGAFAINPVNGEKIPIWIADYVLASYGTGAIMAVPGHDARDLEFARKFALPVRVVVQAPDGKDSIGFLDDGVAVNSDFLNGLPTPEAKRTITAWLEDEGLGKKTINYKLRDWLFSRQRYWGEPFPIVWKRDAGGNLYHEALPEATLPLLPPALDDYKPTADGQPPLARAKDWLTLPDGAVRETNTMPQWAGSCWYYLRYLDAKNSAAFVDREAEGYWMGTTGAHAVAGLDQTSETFRRSEISQTAAGAAVNSPLSSVPPAAPKPTPGVDLYVGGTEHAVLHLLYARFWHKVLYDLGHVSTAEPFFKLVNQGLILGEDGQKMSKARGNVVNPDAVVAEYGADSLRLYEMFMGPLEMVKPWNTKGVEGVYRFLGRVWRLFVDEESETAFEQNLAAEPARGAEFLQQIQPHRTIADSEPTGAQLKTLHACIKKVTEDLDHLGFNTAISALMVFTNEAMTWETRPKRVLREFLLLLQPFAPHLAEELAQIIGAQDSPELRSLAYEPWPKVDPTLLVEATLEIPVQVNGKLRGVVVVPTEATGPQIEAAALADEKVKGFIAGKTIKKIIVVRGKLVNLVVA